MARFRKKAEGMWDTLDGKDVSAASLPTFDWQKDGFRMQQTNVDLARGIDEKNDPGYIPEAEMHVKSIENRDFEDGAVDFNLMQQRSENVKEHKGPFWNGGEKAFAAEEAGEGNAALKQIGQNSEILQILESAFALCAEWFPSERHGQPDPQYDDADT